MPQRRPTPAPTERTPPQGQGLDATQPRAAKGSGTEAREAIEIGAAQIVGTRERQEDHFAVFSSSDPAFTEHAGHLAMVADGMGGMAHGEAASHAATAAFLQAWQTKDAGEAIPAALNRGLLEANIAVGAAAAALGVDDQMGSTLVAASIRENALHWISVGDSNLLLVRDDEITQLNTPHTYAEDLDAKASRGEIPYAEAASDEQRAALTSFLGLAQLPHVDRTLRGFPLLPGDLILIATDGLCNALSGEEILSLLGGLRTGNKTQPQALADVLVNAVECKRLPGQDNTTVVAIGLTKPAPESVLPPAWSSTPFAEVDTSVPGASSVLTPGVAVPLPGVTGNAKSLRRRRGIRLPVAARLAALALGVLLVLLGIYFGPRVGEKTGGEEPKERQGGEAINAPRTDRGGDAAEGSQSRPDPSLPEDSAETPVERRPAATVVPPPAVSPGGKPSADTSNDPHGRERDQAPRGVAAPEAHASPPPAARRRQP